MVKSPLEALSQKKAIKRSQFLKDKKKLTEIQISDQLI